MFPSTGLFAAVNCPSTGLCERPHCFYRHDLESQEEFSASYKSSIVDFSESRNDNPYLGCGASVNNDTKDACLQRLEKINEEIETVRREVELEQIRLSHFQTVQVDHQDTLLGLSISKTEAACKNIVRSSSGQASCTESKRKNPKARKYVVDNSKPRTDLEYDPLSNYSADLRSYSSSGKEPKVQDRKGLKRTKDAVCSNQKWTYDYRCPLSRSPSPDPQGDFYEDSELVIDIFSSPDKKRRKAEECIDLVSDKPLSQEGTELNEQILLDSPSLQLSKTDTLNATSLPASRLQGNIAQSNCSGEINQGLSSLYQDKDCKLELVERSVVDVTKSLEGPGRETQKVTNFQAAKSLEEKSPDSAGSPASKDQVKKMNSLQACDYQPKNLLFYEDSDVNSSVQNKQHTKQGQTMEQPAHSKVTDIFTPSCSLSLLPNTHRTSNVMIGQIQGKTADRNPPPPERYPELAESAAGGSQAQAGHSFSASAEQPSVEASRGEIIIIDSSSDNEDELNCSDVELSDTDPMEECYRIFMEEYCEDKGSEEQPDVSVGTVEVEKPALNVTAGKKRVAHDPKHTEQPVGKSRPEPQVLVPLRGPGVSGFASQSSITTKIQLVQQRASILTASVKGGQAFITTTCQRKPETHRAPSLTQIPENPQHVPVQSAQTTCIPIGTAVVNVGNNLHLILPTSARAFTPSQGYSVLTPLMKGHTGPVTVKQTYHTPLLTPVQRSRTTAPVLIPAQAQKPSLNFASAAAHSGPASSAIQDSVQPTAKPVSTKRKLKQQCESSKDKVPHDIRQRYVNLFTEEFLKTSANVNDAFEKALAEEKTVYNRSMNKLKYLSVAVNALKRLKNQSAVAAKDQNMVNSPKLKGNIPLNLKKVKENDDMPLYESLKDYVLTEEKLIENNYPVRDPERRGCAVLFAEPKKGTKDPLKRICCRCGAMYSVNQTGKHIRQEECNYHYGKGVKNRVPGGVETRYSCCEGVMGAPGCQMFKLHVHDSFSLDGFVSTSEGRSSQRSCPGVYSLDCEMCYTIHGLELSRVTVVNSRLQVIYDTFVRPDGEVIDYNTRFSGISGEDVKDNLTSLREVQETLLSFINAETILIGHSLERDLCALKLLHGAVVDTAAVFPHRLGPPHKLSLNKLTAEYLRRIIQQSESGHDTAEDAAACMELILWKAKEDGKLKK
ncbi:RNA exonuclease 1 homolog isoform X2 [Xyrichtys novacula]|uniref:RNA exonuclease 1 homolog isoform X2 n=1 Tax=Xyrichtys novacula TaxID=13765 RepID=A0AAV1G8C7_XYRNO|nr:RNA exonuclease 1 homolog isoform X2 [Xyrichtys novacula]